MVFSDPFEPEEEPEIFVEMVVRMAWSFLLNHGFLLVFIYCCLTIGSLLFRKLYLEGLFSRWKVWHQYHEILSAMNQRLEATYEIELWQDAEFCANYIKFFEAFRRFRAMCDRDHTGHSITDNWRKVTEAEPLQEFFDADYILHDRLVYAVRGAEGIPREKEEGANEEEEKKEEAIEEEEGERKKNKEGNKE